MKNYFRLIIFSDDEEKKDVLHRGRALGHFRHRSPHDLALHLNLFLAFGKVYAHDFSFSPFNFPQYSLCVAKSVILFLSPK